MEIKSLKDSIQTLEHQISVLSELPNSADLIKLQQERLDYLYSLKNINVNELEDDLKVVNSYAEQTETILRLFYEKNSDKLTEYVKHYYDKLYKAATDLLMNINLLHQIINSEYKD